MSDKKFDLKCLSWNIEGFRRNYLNLKHFCDDYQPQMVFLSEPQIFHCDIDLLASSFRGQYSFLLNSEETSNPELALDCAKAHGGTMILWRSELDPYVVPLPTTSPSFLPILLKIPGFTPSIHVALYLPTSGKDPDFVSALSLLDNFIEEVASTHNCPIYIRGDANCNPRNLARSSLLDHFCSKYKFSSTDFKHPSHHHFTGQGLHDAQLDVLLHQTDSTPEVLTEVICKLSHPLVDSAHDIILSTCPLSPQAPVLHDQSENISAVKVNNERLKVIWDDENTPQYQKLTSDILVRLRETWSDNSSPSAVSILLQSTNDVLSTCAAATNKIINLGKATSSRPKSNPEVTAAQSKVLRLSKLAGNLSSSSSATDSQIIDARRAVTAARAECRRISNYTTMVACNERDAMTHSVLTSNPEKLYRFVKASNNKSSARIKSLKVGNKVYTGNSVPDGFFDSLSSLKSPDMTKIYSSPSYQSAASDYATIKKICSTGLKIPAISARDATEILYSLKPDVNDLFSITARHYINAGMEGAKHFHFLMNHVISNINLFSLPELNSVWAMVLHKGHGKPKDEDRSYRTISTCPLLSKSLDKYIGSLYESGWAGVQAETQFQGTGSSHELAALLLTETIQFSLHSAKKPLFVLLLDAKSAFDKILSEVIIKNAFLAGSRGQGLLYLADRLANRLTFVEWDKCLMGPILDKLGVEQGGVLSDRLYKLANNEQLSTAQLSQLGLVMGNICVSSIGQADDTGLVSDCIFKLQHLLQLTEEYCAKYHVELVPEKTKLLCFAPPGLDASADYWKLVSPVSLGNKKISFSDEAEHVGILRSVHGNLPNIFTRISAHNNALRAVLPAGLARGHCGNPAASLRIETLYGSPKLLSGLSSLVLSKAEKDILHHHYKLSLERLQRLHKATPEPFVCFLGGSLPLTALLEFRQLSLFGMVSRLDPSSILHRHATYTLLNSKPSSRSWFLQIRDLSTKYSLPNPLMILTNPPTKSSFKRSTKSKVVDFWETKLREDASHLDSLIFFKPHFYSLTKPHPIWTSAGNNPYEVEKACCQARMLSGRFRTCWLSRHWSGDSTGFCNLPMCRQNPTPGTLPHILTECEDLAPARQGVFSLWSAYLKDKPFLFPIIRKYTITDNATEYMQFMLDCTVLPDVITLRQQQGRVVYDSLLYLTRTLCFSVHKARLKLLGKWNLK